MATAQETRPIRACRLEDLERERTRVLSAGGQAILLVYEEGRVHALDNRCPHMGFPLHRGTVKDGILTCHWHHAKFDLASGCTFDLFADDATCYPVAVQEGEVWVHPRPAGSAPRSRSLRRLAIGLERGLSLVLAKSALRLAEADAAREALRAAASFGLRNRRAGWSPGLTILTACGAMLPWLDESDRPLALYHGLLSVAEAVSGQPPDFDLEPLSDAEAADGRYREWFRSFVEVREEDAAERTLVTAIAGGQPPAAISDMVFAGCTDHRYLDTGHVLDFANKAFELLALIGWEHAAAVLSSLVPAITRGQRMEESSTWRHPVDVAALVEDAAAELVGFDLLANGAGWDDHAALAELVLDGEPAETVEELLRLLRTGVPVTELSCAVAYAGARRAVHFSTGNEFADWETVLHGFTFASAVDQALRRSPSPLLGRGVLDAAMAVQLERFLNVPKRALPRPSGAHPEAGELLAGFDRQGCVDEAAQLVTDMLAAGRDREVVRTLGHALLREDATFHHFQMYEAGVRQWTQLRGRPEGGHVLVGVARYLAAHYPTVRARWQTFDIASRLLRGDSIAGEAGLP